MSAQLVTKLSSKKLDTSSRKKSCPTGSEKKLVKKTQTQHKRKPVPVSVTEKVDGVHNLEQDSPTSHSFVHEQIVAQEKQKIEASKTRPSSSIAENAEHKRALVEMKRLEKKRLEEERLLKEKENLELQEFLEKQRQEQIQQQVENTSANNIVDSNSFLEAPKIKYPYVTPGQVSGLAALERLKVLQEGLELSAVDEGLDEKSIQRDQEVDELLQRAKEAEATYLAKLRDRERLQRIKKVS